MAEDDDIRDVIKEETRRGRSRLEIDNIRKKQRAQAAMLRAVRNKDLRGFMDALRVLGVTDDSPDFARLVASFRQKTGA